MANESAKLLALRAKNVLTCQRALRVWVLLCQRALLAYLRVHVPTCLVCLGAHVQTCFAWSRSHVPMFLECLHVSRVNVPCVLIDSCVNVPCELTCSRANMPWVLYLTWLAWPCDHLPTCLASSVTSLIPLFLVSLQLLLIMPTVGKIWEFNDFPQQREFIYNPNLLIIYRLRKREYKLETR